MIDVETGRAGQSFDPSKRVALGIMMLAAALTVVGIIALLWTISHWSSAPAEMTVTSSPSSGPALPKVEPMAFVEVDADRARRINAAIPFAAGLPEVARPFYFAGSAEDRDRASGCLASAVLFEAGDDPVGERAVAQVVLNRVRHRAFPKSVCAVVFQGADRPTGCQFTFTCDGALARHIGMPARDRALVIARSALAGAVAPQVGLATHYHTDWVVPRWNADMEKIAQVGTHLFFRWKGTWGRHGAFEAPGEATEPRISQLAMLFSGHGAVPATVDLSSATTAAGAAERPPVVIPDISTAQLRGFVVLAAHPDGDAYLVQVPMTAFAGSYAVAALAICRDRPYCKVAGWRTAADVPHNFPIGTAARATLSFLYEHRVAGAEIVKWDCQATPRPSADQCLPLDASERSRLLKGIDD